MNLDQLTHLFRTRGARELYAKELARNDNNKNQVYFAGDMEALNAFPSREIYSAENTQKGPTFKASLNFGWLTADGRVENAPEAKLIVYAQYPEVRFSGFLTGCSAAPSELMMDRERAKRSAVPELAEKLAGRVLFVGVTSDRQLIGYVAAGDSEIAREFRDAVYEPAFVVFRRIPLPNSPTEADARNQLLRELRRIHGLGWINSKQLGKDGLLRPCVAPQCGGFTLEAELGIPKNSAAEPDYLGWEIKQHTVTRFDGPDAATAITLMTPEPTGGFYTQEGAEAFVRRFGYPDTAGRPDRINFGGIHRVGEMHEKTTLRMALHGYDVVADRIQDANGCLALLTESGEIAAAWGFSELLTHWARKHTKAVYVPSMKRDEPCRQYAYGGRVRLAQRTNSLRLLRALASGTVYYDPGIKLECASSNPALKRRSQFRVASKQISALYEVLETVQLEDE